MPLPAPMMTVTGAAPGAGTAAEALGSISITAFYARTGDGGVNSSALKRRMRTLD
jgi:hypothetical protein